MSSSFMTESARTANVTAWYDESSTWENDVKLQNNYMNRVYTVSDLLYIALMAVISVFGIVGNCCIITTVVKTQLLHTPTYTLITCLALSDLFVSLGVVFLLVLVSKTAFLQNVILCTLSICIIYFGIVASAICLLGVAMERTFAIEMPLRYASIVTMRRATVTSALIFLYCFGLFVIFPIILNAAVSPKTCMSSNKSFVIYKDISILHGIIVLLILIGLYSKIAHSAVKQRRRIFAQSGYDVSQLNVLHSWKVAKETLTLVGTYAVLFLPYGITQLLQDLGYIKNAPAIFGICILINSAVNPLIYAFRMKEVKAIYKSKFSCCDNPLAVVA